jgi:hypothetical protein
MSTKIIIFNHFFNFIAGLEHFQPSCIISIIMGAAEIPFHKRQQQREDQKRRTRGTVSEENKL